MAMPRKADQLHDLHNTRPHDRTADVSSVPAGRPRIPKDISKLGLRKPFKNFCHMFAMVVWLDTIYIVAKSSPCTLLYLVVKFAPSRMKRSSQAGFVLLMDLMVSLLLMSVLLAMAVPQVVQIQRTNEMIAAKARVANLASVESAISLCNATPGCHPSVALTAQIPPLGSTVRQGAYQYTFTDLGGGLWAYQAAATGSVFSPTGHDFWVGTAGILYCSDWPDTSNPC